MRRGTRAALMPNQITERVKAERSDILIRLGEENKKAYELERAGSPCEFLAEEKEEIDGTVYFSGYTREYIRVLMKAPENSGEDMAGRLLQGTYSFSDKGCIFTPIVLK